MINSFKIDGITYKIDVDYENEVITINIPYAMSKTNCYCKKSFIRMDLLEDSKGNYYFLIPDLRKLKQTKNYLDTFWNDKAYDAYTLLQDKIADALFAGEEPFTNNIRLNHDIVPVKFLDEKIGKEYREQSLQGWKDSKCKYVISKYLKERDDRWNDYLAEDWNINKNMFLPYKLDSHKIFMTNSYNLAIKILRAARSKYIDSKTDCPKWQAVEEANKYNWIVKQVII